MLKIITTTAVLAILALADGPILQTGQVTSYDANGHVVLDGSVKDDGYYRAGIARVYGRSGDVVIDNATGLQWQDDVQSVQKPLVDAGGDTAGLYCTTRSIGGYTDWRVPTIEELQTLVDYASVGPSTTRGIFQHISRRYYWSSTNAYADSAWGVNFYDGYSYHGDKTEYYPVRCVRGGQLAPSNLSRNDMTTIVTDSTTGLQWQDNAIVKSTDRTWIDAINYCENTLLLGGYNDWRLPNINELLSIVDYSQIGPAINKSVFVNTSSYSSDYYLSSSRGPYYPDSAWFVYFSNGYSNYGNKDFSGYVRCVRGGQLGHSANPSIIMYLLN